MNYINVGTQLLALAFVAWPTGAFAQQVSPAAGNPQISGAPAAAAQVPRLVRFSGAVKDAGGKPVSSMAGITFALYQDQEGGTPLWIENQNVQPDAAGRYTVWLGATKNDGMPLELFASGQARWLGVQVEGQPEQARVLLAAVPYALKAGDADTLGGKPASAYLMAAPAASMQPESASATGAAVQPASGAPAKAAARRDVINGTLGYIPYFYDTSSDLRNSVIYQSGSNIGIGTTSPGQLLTLQTGATGYTFLENLYGSVDPGNGATRLEVGNPVSALMLTAYGSKAPGILGGSAGVVSLAGPLLVGNAAVNAPLYLYAGNKYTAPQFTLTSTGNVGIGTQTPAATLEVNGNAQVDGNLTLKGLATFGAGQTFPDTPQLNTSNTFSANQTVNGTVTGTQFVSTVATGSAPLLVSSTTQVANLNASYLGGLSAGNFQPAGTIPLPFAGSAASSGTLFTLTNTAAGANGMAAYGAQAAVNTRFSGTGVLGYGGASSATPAGIVFTAAAGTGVYGTGGTGTAPTNGYTVIGGIGVDGQGGTGYSNGGDGVFAGGGSGTNSAGGTGIVASGGSGPGGTYGNAGFFSGNVEVTGSVSKSSGSFKIDHPLDPANKYLYHSFVESPDMKNIYDGTVVTDGSGTAVVTMPPWFEALNTDFRYQLTVIGQFAQAIIASEITNGSFTIKTDKPSVKVSWQVTGIRQDAWAKAHRIEVEVEKAPKEQGHYLHPELYGHAGEPGIPEVLHPRLRKP